MSYKLMDCLLDHEIQAAKMLLKKNGLSFETNVDLTLGIYDQDTMIATGSLYENVIKMIAVDEKYQGEHLTGLLLFELMSRLHQKMIYKIFLFTKPEAKKYFIDYGFSLIYEDKIVAFLENNIDTIRETLQNIKQNLKLKEGTTAAIVMNCNPMTNGHLYLIDTCAKSHDNVLIFLVEENKSVFPFDVRFDIAKKATCHHSNVIIIPSTQYIISSATFPTYFIKELNEASKAFMKLDVTVFKNHFMKIFNIDVRYVGSEPLDETTQAYNRMMKKILGSKVIVIDRMLKDGQFISASFARKLAKEQRFDELKEIVPKSTYQFLISEQGRALFK